MLSPLKGGHPPAIGARVIGVVERKGPSSGAGRVSCRAHRPVAARGAGLVFGHRGRGGIGGHSLTRDLRKVPMADPGDGAMVTHRDIAVMPDLTTTGAAISGEPASTAAGYGAGRMDMVQLCDAFAINTLVFHADPGFCPKGEGGRLVQGGRLAVRTNGANPQGTGRCQTTTRGRRGCPRPAPL